MTGSRHGSNKRSSQKRGAAFLTVASLMVAPLALSVHPLGVRPAVASVSHSAIRSVYIDNLISLSVVLKYVPGTGYDETASPDDTYAWLDNGVYQQIPSANRTALNDKSQYPGTLESSGDNSGENSVEKGSDWLVSLVLQQPPGTTVQVVPGGSQGAMVVLRAAIKLAAMGYPMENFFGILYSDPYTPGTGIVDRFSPGDPVLTTGLTGGAPALPSTGTYLRVNVSGDPISHFVRYPINILADIDNVFGFVFSHGDIGNINWSDPRNDVVVDGNVTTVTLYKDVIPLLIPLKLLGVPSDVITIIQDIVGPIVENGGKNEPGRLQLLPSPDEMVRQIVNILNGFVQAGVDIVKLIQGQPLRVIPPSTGTSSLSQELIDKALAQDVKVNGGTSAISEVPSVNARLATVVPSTQGVSDDITSAGAKDAGADATSSSTVTTSSTPAPQTEASVPSTVKPSVVSEPTQAHETTSSTVPSADKPSESTTPSSSKDEVSTTDSADKDGAKPGKTTPASADSSGEAHTTSSSSSSSSTDSHPSKQSESSDSSNSSKGSTSSADSGGGSSS